MRGSTLYYDYICTEAFRPHGESPAAPAVAAHDHGLAGEKKIGGLHNAVQRALAGAVAVVEHHLCLGVVDGNDGIKKRFVLGHGPQAHDTGGGLLAAAEHLGGKLRMLLVDDGDGVGSVVQTDIGFELQGLLDAVVVLFFVLAPEGVDIEAARCQRCRHFVLSGEGIGACDRNLGPARYEGGDEVGCLHSHVQAGHDARALEGQISLELLLDLLQNGHMPAGPFDALFSCFCQTWILDDALLQKYHLEIS